jgi:DNA repair exonuclease SbcCD ATPase subunit
MIVFKTIEWSNFLSTGNSANKVILNQHSTNLIVGKNGEGKSTILDALCFVLFNKPFRDINRPQLVNSINQKNCLVEIEFDIGPAQYKIIRGIKPAIFEIYLNGELINQDAAAKDYQKVLEQQILKLNYKTFTQVIILGSASFVPFMQLPTGQRREVIEDILDIRVFSQMNQILKENMTKTKEKINALETEIRIISEQAKAQQKIIESLQNSKDSNIKAIQEKIKANKIHIQQKLDHIDTLNAEVEKLNASLPLSEELKQNSEMVQKNWSKYEALVDQLDGQMSFFNSDNCPACKQNIDHEHKETIVNDMLTKKEEYLKNMGTIKAAQEKLTEQIKASQVIIGQVRDLSIEMSTENSAISMLTKANSELEKDISTQDTNIDVASEKDKLKQIATDAISKNNEKVELNKKQRIEEIASTLLKDTGIKTTIIKEYLPVMNKLINMYLSTMDFFVKFELDESFNEKIKSRFRDEFTYASFSEGEKQKIDLALLFTWRKIAKMKNSVNTNLLLMDEIFDSSLDTQGTEYLLQLLNTLEEGTNIFVISHKGDVLLDRFKNNIRFEKHNDFSVIHHNS